MSRPCPVCGRPAAAAPGFAPFCSRRCADVDLGRWLTGRYAIPAAAGDAGEVPPAPAGPAAGGGPGRPVRPGRPGGRGGG